MRMRTTGVTAGLVCAAAALTAVVGASGGAAASLKIDGGVAQTFTFERPFEGHLPTVEPGTPSNHPGAAPTRDQGNTPPSTSAEPVPTTSEATPEPGTTQRPQPEPSAPPAATTTESACSEGGPHCVPRS